MTTHGKFIAWTWLCANAIALGLFGFADSLILRVIGAMWIAAAISFGGLMAVGAVFSGKNEDG